MLTSQLTSNLSLTWPNSSPHGAFSSGTSMSPPSASLSKLAVQQLRDLVAAEAEVAVGVRPSSTPGTVVGGHQGDLASGGQLPCMTPSAGIGVALVLGQAHVAERS